MNDEFPTYLSLDYDEGRGQTAADYPRLEDKLGKAIEVTRTALEQYRSPAVFLDELTIRGEVTRWGRTSFEVSWLGDVPGEREGDPQRRIFEGVMAYVCVDGDRTPTPVDATFRANMPRRDPRARL